MSRLSKLEEAHLTEASDKGVVDFYNYGIETGRNSFRSKTDKGTLLTERNADGSLRHQWHIIDQPKKKVGAVESNKLLTQIATEYLWITTLRTRYSDRLDFHEVSVWQLKKALRAAYEAGKEAAKEAA